MLLVLVLARVPLFLDCSQIAPGNPAAMASGVPSRLFPTPALARGARQLSSAPVLIDGLKHSAISFKNIG